MFIFLFAVSLFFLRSARSAARLFAHVRSYSRADLNNPGVGPLQVMHRCLEITNDISFERLSRELQVIAQSHCAVLATVLLSN